MFIFKLNLKTFLLKWKRFLVFICLTALLTVLAGLLGSYFLYYHKIEPVVIVIVDNDKTMESRVFYSMASGLEEYKDLIVFENADDVSAAQMIESGYATAVFTIPKGFTEKVKNGENEPFSVIYNMSSPLKAQLVKYFSDAFEQMLMASQIGIYTGLDYARDFDGASRYTDIYRAINLRYLNLLLMRSSVFDVNGVSVINNANVFQYYFFAGYIFIMLACSMLFIDAIQANMRGKNLVKLYALEKGAFTTAVWTILSVFAALCVINAVFIGAVYGFGTLFSIDIGFGWIVFLFSGLIMLAVSAFTVAVSAAFGSVFSAGVFVSIFSFASLFLSGGVVPSGYFSPLFKTISGFVFNSWAVKSLVDAASRSSKAYAENCIALGIFIVVFLAVAVILFSFARRRAGDRA